MKRFGYLQKARKLRLLLVLPASQTESIVLVEYRKEDINFNAHIAAFHA